jgi:hypothetical protein
MKRQIAQFAKQRTLIQILQTPRIFSHLRLIRRTRNPSVIASVSAAIQKKPFRYFSCSLLAM